MRPHSFLLTALLLASCTPRSGGGGGGFFDPDAAADHDVAGGDDAATAGDVSAADVVDPTDAPTGGDVVISDDVSASCVGDASCGAGRFCDMGTCRAQVCTPGAASCRGAVAITLCDPRGASQVEMPCPGGSACMGGRCQAPRVCEPGASRCAAEASREVCTPDGTAYLVVACASGERCSGGVCAASQVCSPGARSCGADGQLRTCNELGTGYAAMSCGATPNATTSCQDGRCVANCTAGFANCDGETSNGCEVELASSAANCGSCNNACSAGRSCVSGACVTAGPMANFRVASLLATGCAVVDHGGVTGDDRGPIAAGSGVLLVSGDTATARINTVTRAVERAGGITDFISSNLRSGQIVSFASASGALFPGGTGGSAAAVVVVDPATGLPTGAPLRLSQPINLQVGAGFFAGWDRVVVFAQPTLWNVNLTNGQVDSLGPFNLQTYAACENGGVWGVAETQGAETDLVYVESSTTIARRRVSTGARSAVGAFSNLGDMCGIAVHPASGQWFFHYESSSQFGPAGDELAGWCPATFSMGGPACSPPSLDCGGSCINPMSDATHCGRCGNACPSGQTCSSGVCAASPGGYARSTPAISWIDACALPGVTRVLPSVDDSVATTTLPFLNFLFFGQRASAARISSNGFLSFDPAAGAATAGLIPNVSSPNAVIAPFWVDLRTGPSGVCYATSGSAPSRSFIVQWQAATHFSGGGGPNTFQLRLNEADNSIDFVYQSAVNAPSGYNLTVGIESWDGRSGDAVCAGFTACSTITPSSRYRFTPR